MTYAHDYLTETGRLLDGLDLDALERMAEALADVRARGGRLFCLGNGGGAAHASHLASDLRIQCGIEAYAPSDHIALMSAIANDFDFSSVFCEYLATAHLSDADGLLVFSGSGGSDRSINLVHAVIRAQEDGCTCLGILGQPGHLSPLLDVAIVIGAEGDSLYPQAEGIQSVIAHALAWHPSLRRTA